VVRSRSFAQADLDTALIPREEAALFHQQPVPLALAAAAAVACTLLDERALAGADPFSRRDGFRSHGQASRRFEFDFADAHVKAQLDYQRDGGLHLRIADPAGGEVAGLLAFDGEGDAIDLRFANLRERVVVYTQGETDHVFASRGAAAIVSLDLLAHAGEGQAEGGRLTAPMPGKVISIAVKAGDTVRKGQPLAVMEAMKMEHTIAAPADGTVAEVLYAPGDQVAEGAELLKLAAAA
jgi:3-methylcrotonyl-CoA carboxylase alpha subunit